MEFLLYCSFAAVLVILLGSLVSIVLDTLLECAIGLCFAILVGILMSIVW